MLGATKTQGLRIKFAAPLLRDRALPPGVILPGLALEQQLRDGDDGVPFFQQRLQNAGQRLGRVFRGVVEQHDAPRLYVFQHPACDLLRRNPLPIQAVAFPNG